MIIGKGNTINFLSESQVSEICAEAFERSDFNGKRVLAIIPDHTRTAPMDLLFRIVYEFLADRVTQLDFMVALGTHQPMSEEMINERVGITQQERFTKYPKARFFNHEWQNPAALTSIGVISEDEVAEISNNLMRQQVEVTINKRVLDYDLLLIIGPTFPHEVVGFSGGNKYLFPGIAGAGDPRRGGSVAMVEV